MSQAQLRIGNLGFQFSGFRQIRLLPECLMIFIGLKTSPIAQHAAHPDVPQICEYHVGDHVS